MNVERPSESLCDEKVNPNSVTMNGVMKSLN